MNFYDKYDDTRAQNGIGTQLNIWDETLSKYVLLMPLETVPSVVGSKNTVDVDLLTSSMITKIEGKSQVDDKDVTFLLHRDNLRILKKIAGKQCKFLISYPDYTGWKFEGKISYKPDDASSDKLTGTFTIVANQVDQYETEDVRDMMARTCFITSAVPFELFIKAGATSEVTLNAISSSATFEAKSNVSTITASIESNKLKITAPSTIQTEEVYGLIEITAKATGMASWTTSIAVTITKA